jgi:hypothetical protein
MRGHGDRQRYDERDEFSQSGLDDGWRNEDYYFERVRDRGYDNRDYSGNNYWPSRGDVRDERYGQYNDYVPALDYGRGYRSAGRDHATGYGNEGSRYMRDFENWRQGGSSYSEGYGGRNADDYRNGYGDRRHYDPSENFSRNDRDFDDRGSYQRGNSYQYDDYQSYPAYEARGYRREEWDPRESRRFRNRPQNEGREYGNRHRPSIREKRY